MNDLEIINQIENELNVKLRKISNLEGRTNGYILNESNRIVAFTLQNYEKVKLSKIVSYLRELQQLTRLKRNCTS